MCANEIMDVRRVCSYKICRPVRRGPRGCSSMGHLSCRPNSPYRAGYLDRLQSSLSWVFTVIGCVSVAPFFFSQVALCSVAPEP